MNILAIGDVVAARGCEFLRKALPNLKKNKGIDLCIANAENSAQGNGVTPESARFLLDSGVDLLTGGNHSFRRREVYEFLDESRSILRPANYHAGNPGQGFTVIDMGRTRAAVVNLSGVCYLENAENPFLCIDKILAELAGIPIILVDFHAEATSEKRAMGFYLDGRISALFGTHTHVQTADAQILPQGTGYISDLGMTGSVQSVLGVAPELSIRWLKTGMPTRFEAAEGGKDMLNGCIFSVDEKSGKCIGVERVWVEG